MRAVTGDGGRGGMATMAGERARRVGRYAPLAAALAAQPGPYCERSLAALAALLGLPRLPEAAYRSRRWWRNDPSHRQARDGWLAAGWRVADADLAAGLVTFVRDARGAG